MAELVSVIIPVYNDERYISDCIKSAINQTHKDLEIIIIDDGSTDSSPKLCDLIAATDPRVQVIHKANGGLSSARNVGMDLAAGKYITFLDSDDYLSPSFVADSLSACKRNRANAAILKMAYVGEHDTQQTFAGDTDEEEVMFSEEAIKESLYQKRFSCCAPGTLYKRKVIDGIRFPLGKLSEDLAVFHLFMDRASRIVYVDTTGYYYRQRPKSIMHTFSKRRLDALEWAKQIEKYCSEKHPDIISAAVCRTFNVAVHLLLDMPENDTEYLPAVWTEIKRTRLTVIRDRKARGRERAAALLSFVGASALRRAWRSRLAVRKDR